MGLRKTRIKKKTRKQRGGSVPRCQCSSECKQPVIKGNTFCAEHIKNGCPIKSPLSGYEPEYNPGLYNNDKSTQHSHNCFAYAMDVRDPDRIYKCRNTQECSTPQPGRKKGHPEFSGQMGKTCGDVISRTMADVNKAYLTNFESKCQPGFSKIFSAVDKKHDYHYWRQDDNKTLGNWSHKPGGRPVTNIDANGAKIFRPDLAARDYPAEYEGDTGLDYSSACGYMCVPRKTIQGVNPIQIAGRHTKRRRSYS